MVEHLDDHDGPRLASRSVPNGRGHPHILGGMRDGDRLDAVEISESFAVALEADVAKPHRAGVSGAAVPKLIFQCPIEDADLEGPYHRVVCGLPFNNALELTKHIFGIMLDSMHPEGWLSYFDIQHAR